MFKFIVFVIAAISYVEAHAAASAASSSSDSSSTSSSSNKNNNYNTGFGPNFPFTNFPQMQFPQIQFPQMPQMKFPQMPQIVMPQMPRINIPTFKPLTPEDVEKLSANGGSVSGMAETMTSHTEWVDGKPVTKTTGVVIVNKDGKVSKTTYGN